MRENNWEFARDSSAGMGNCYACDRGEAYLSRWEKGIGVSQEWTVDPHWRAMRSLTARVPAMVAVELGIRYTMREENS